MTDKGNSSLILQDRVSTEVEPDPITKKIFISLPEPGLSDNRADVDRLRQELGRVIGPVDIDLDLMNSISSVLKESGWRATAAVGICDRGWSLVSIEKGDTSGSNFGLAVDIGTTTVVAYLVDMNTGDVIDVEACYNGQVKYGDDILTRIFRAQDHEGAALMQRAIINSLNGLILLLSERNSLKADVDITAVSVGANTTMVHLFLGLDTGNICVAPYIPLVNDPGIIKSEQLGLNVLKKAPVYIFPSVGSYLGGDIIAGILASGMHKRNELALLVDIGTNGEIVMGNAQWMVACAGAAGPALEGGVAASGMRAEQGAVSEIKIDHLTKEVKYHTIGGHAPLGICGSGLVDGIAEMFLAGLIDRSGRFREGRDYLVVVGSSRSGTGKDIVISQQDISNFMRTKGAVNAALELLLESVGCGLGDIERFYAAGAFGHHLDFESAVTLGLYPDLPREKMVKIGNSSGEGARLALMSRKCIEEARRIAANITYFELNANQEFMNKFVSSKFIPHTNMDYYPTVKRRLRERGLLVD
ncbi:MAG: ferredoxin [Peptococcaceae bacterium BRH_c4a]|nr:MAG: ferredoxin [Peptococcaceae bacterium BRH_c4a]